VQEKSYFRDFKARKKTFQIQEGFRGGELRGLNGEGRKWNGSRKKASEEAANSSARGGGGNSWKSTTRMQHICEGRWRESNYRKTDLILLGEKRIRNNLPSGSRRKGT